MACRYTRLILAVILPSFIVCQGKDDSFSPVGYNKILIGKSWGLPLELKCEDIESPRIKVSGITLAHKTNTVTAEDEYPGIQVKAQKDCDRTHTMPTRSRPAECRIQLPEMGVPNNVMVITVFWCYSGAQHYANAVKNRIASSKVGDVKIMCSSNDIINIREIKIENEPVDDLKSLTSKCLSEMMKSILPNGRGNETQPHASCSIERKGRKGDLQVRYNCEGPPKHARYVIEPEPSSYPMPPTS